MLDIGLITKPAVHDRGRLVPHKLLAWEGVSLTVPWRWDLGKHFGDAVLGGFRVDSEHRAVVHVQWWRQREPIDPERVIKRYVKRGLAAVGKAIDLPAGDLAVAKLYEVPAEDSASAGDLDLLLVAQDKAQQRGLLLRVEVRDGQPEPALVQTMLTSVRSAGPVAWRNWGMFEFVVQSPPGYRLFDANLSAGVCYLRFAPSRWRYLGLRRFSAASALLRGESATPATLERVVRAVYADANFDMRYRASPGSAVDAPAGQIALRLDAQRRRPALEWRGFFPRFRASPHRIDIRYDPEHDKLLCFEVRGRHDAAALARFIDGARAQPGQADAARAGESMPLPPGTTPSAHHRSLRSTIIRSKSVKSREDPESGVVKITYTLQRPPRLRVLRLLAGHSTAAAIERTTELDPIGSMLWQACDRRRRVIELIDLFMQRFHVSYREAELSVTHYLRLLGTRGLLSIQVPRE